MPQNYQLVKIIFDCLIIHFFKLYSGLSFIHSPQNELCCLKTVKWNYGKLWNLIFWRDLRKKKTVSILKDWSGERLFRTYNSDWASTFKSNFWQLKLLYFLNLAPSLCWVLLTYPKIFLSSKKLQFPSQWKVILFTGNIN